MSFGLAAQSSLDVDLLPTPDNRGFKTVIINVYNPS